LHGEARYPAGFGEKTPDWTAGIPKEFVPGISEEPTFPGEDKSSQDDYNQRNRLQGTRISIAQPPRTK
jgi:hypothetical protein